MRRHKATVLAVLAGAVLATAGAARAQQFEALAAQATRIDDGRALAALFWTMTGSCSGAADDVQRRMCEGVRAARAERNAGRVYAVVGDGSALTIEPWDQAKGWSSISVRGCLSCALSVEIAGENRYITTRGAVAIRGGALVGPELKRAVRKAPSQEEAEKWAERVGARLKVEILFKVPARAQEWSEGGARGYAVELAGFRVVDPCDGTVLAAEPPSGAAPPDRAACIGETEPTAAPAGPDSSAPVGPAEPELPLRPTPRDINSSMQRARAEVNACFANYGVAGKADLVIEIQNDGSVKDVKLSGEFVDTPTGECIVKAVKSTQFPKFRAKSVNIRYPFILR